MKSKSLLSSVLLTLVVGAIMSSRAAAQIDLDDAVKHGLTTAVTTTMRVQSETSSMTVTGKHQLLREALLLFIRDQGLAGLEVSFPMVQWPDGSQSNPEHSGYAGELINGYHRFIQNNIGEAIAANQNLETAVDQMLKSASITVPEQNKKAKVEMATPRKPSE